MEAQSNLNNQETTDETEGQQTVIPDFEIDALARCLLPKIQAYFNSPEGQKAFEDWQKQHYA